MMRDGDDDGIQITTMLKTREEREGARTSQLVSDIVNKLHLVVDDEMVS